MSASSESRVRVRYAETDQMGFAWHGEYLAWFEVGRTDWLRAQGLSYRDLEAEGLRLPVIEAQVKYRRPARYDDELRIRTAVTSFAGARVEFSYAVLRAEEELATGSTVHAAVDTAGRPRRLPEELRRVLA